MHSSPDSPTQVESSRGRSMLIPSESWCRRCVFISEENRFNARHPCSSHTVHGPAPLGSVKHKLAGNEVVVTCIGSSTCRNRIKYHHLNPWKDIHGIRITLLAYCISNLVSDISCGGYCLISHIGICSRRYGSSNIYTYFARRSTVTKPSCISPQPNLSINFSE